MLGLRGCQSRCDIEAEFLRDVVFRCWYQPKSPGSVVRVHVCGQECTCTGSRAHINIYIMQMRETRARQSCATGDKETYARPSSLELKN